MVRTTGFVGLFGVLLAVTSSFTASVSAHGQHASTSRSLAGGTAVITATKSSQPKYSVAKVSSYDDATDLSIGGAEEPRDPTTSEEELVDASGEEDLVDYETLFAQLTGLSGASEATESPADAEASVDGAALPVDSSGDEEPIDFEALFAEVTGSSGEDELSEASGEDEPAGPATDEEETVASSSDAEPTDSYTEDELTDLPALVDTSVVQSASARPTTAPATNKTAMPVTKAPAPANKTSTPVRPTPAPANKTATTAPATNKTAAPVTTVPAPTTNKTSTPVTKVPATIASVTTAPASKASATKAPEPKAPAQPYKPPAVVFSLPNWIGTRTPTDKACYRKTHLTKKCSPGYEFDKIATCWAECPVEYPVECGMECIPQNKDCALAVIDKVNAVATVALNAATSGVFGKLVTASKGVQRGVKCVKQLHSATKKVVGYAKELGVKFPNSTKSQVLTLLSKSDFAIYDLPSAVTTCLGLPMPTSLANAPKVTAVIKKLLEKVTVNGESILAPSSFVKVTEEVGAGESVGQLNPTDLGALTKVMDSGVTCGSDLKAIIDRVMMAVQQMKTASPTSPVDMIRLSITSSNLFLKDIPAVTSSCVPKDSANAYETRDDIRKTFEVMIDQVFDASSNGDKPLSKAEYALKMTDMGLDAVAMLDPTGIASMAKEFIQPICGPTSFLGEVDDGALDQALGLRTVGKAFAGSSGTWTKAGDGVLKIVFESTDKKNVKVNIMSGGNKITEVSVKKGETVTWTKPLAEMKDKTMYLDRWRPGLFGLPGTGGGSLLLWVPHTSEGGHLELHAKINVS